jgi:hypothetical protein
MFKVSIAVRELLLLVALTCIISPLVYCAFGAVGGIAWALLGERFVRYSDQYEWLSGCVAAGHYSGLIGVFGCVAWWARGRWADWRTVPAQTDRASHCD